MAPPYERGGGGQPNPPDTAAITTSATNTNHEPPDASNKRKKHNTLESSGFRSFIAGLSAGMASTVAGYVPDTIKVRLQTQPLSEPVRYKGAVDCAVRMVREEGMGSLFRGMSTPLMSRAVVNGMCFSTYTLTMKLMFPDGGAPLPAVFFAGGCAGATSALIASPTELIKVQMQLGIILGGPVTHFRRLVKHTGVKNLLLLGMFPTILRDFVCMGTFFTTTSEFSRIIAKAYPNSPVSHVSALLGGAMAGVAGWALCYPFDVWKSNVQQHFEAPHATTNTLTSTPSTTNSSPAHSNTTTKTMPTLTHIHNPPTNQQPLSFFGFFRERYKVRGLRGLYSGLGPTLFRAIPVNATKFFAFDLVIRMFHMSSEM